MGENNISASGHHKSCPSCGGMLRYDIKSKKLICESCKSRHDLSIYDDLQTVDGKLDVLEYRCPQCGARLHTTNTNMVSYCNYCGSEALFTERMTSTRRPDRIIPFQVTKEQCEAYYREHMGNLLNKDEPLHFQPVYVPFYWYRETFEGEMKGQYVVVDDTSYTDCIKYTTWERTFDARITVEGELECASSQFETETANQLQFRAADVKPFSPGYLCGFFAESPDLDPNVKEGKMDTFARELAKEKINEEIQRTITTLSLPPKKENEDEAELVLLPVWLLARGMGQRVLYTAVKGVDERIVCDKPISTVKVFRTALIASVILFALLFLFKSAVILQPGMVVALCALLTSAGYYCINTRLTMHNQNQQIHEARRETKRCDVLRDESSVTTITATEQGWEKMRPLLWLIGFFLMFALGLSSNVLKPIGILSFWCLLKFIIALVKRPTQPLTVVKEGKVLEWLVLYGIWPILVAVILFVLVWAFKNYNAAVGLLVSDRSWLTPAICIYSAVLLIIQLKGAVLDSPLDNLLCMLTVIVNLMAALLVFAPIKWIPHCLSIAQMTPLLLSMLRLIRRHNEFISRPVPFFREGDIK